MLGRLLLVAALALGAACTKRNYEDCAVDAECLEVETPGLCLQSPYSPNSYCAFPDATCSSGHRWGVLADDGLAEMCVDQSPFDAGVPDAAAADARPADASVPDATDIDAGNQPPVAVAGDNIVTSVGITVTFDGTGSYDPDGTIVSYLWEFGDGTPAAGGAVTSHAFASAATYTVRLVVSDNDDASDADTLTVTVNP